MRTKIMLENVDELFRAANRTRVQGDDFPIIYGTLVLSGKSAHLEDPSCEWTGTVQEVCEKALKLAGFEPYFT